MTVDELIVELQKLSAQGHGALTVRTYSPMTTRFEGNDEIDGAELHETEDGPFIHIR